ncbi:MAG: type II toxin-antitoxin system HicB family antitoxin [Gammaproteobacteria bacterium]|nr:type II toxin-antitoxin system HicB family antitoxin [Gammaproteobacteria bacterium]
MNLRVVVHEAEEGGYWAEVPAVPGCVTQADTLEELREYIHEAIEGCLSVEIRDIAVTETDQVIEVAV